MPYEKISELPDSVKNVLPKEAQEIWMKAFNAAEKEYDDEETAFKVAWDTVKKKYRPPKEGEGKKWVKERAELCQEELLSDYAQYRATIGVVEQNDDSLVAALKIINAKHARVPLGPEDIYIFEARMSTQALDSYGTRQHETSLRNYLTDAQAGVPLMNSHRGARVSLLGFDPGELPLGRSYGAELGGREDGLALDIQWYTLRDLKITDLNTDDVIRGIDGGIAKSTSIGFSARPDGWYECSICGQRLGVGDCHHIPLMMYDGQRAFAWVMNAQLIEGSLVYSNSCPGTIVLQARREARAGRLSPVDVEMLEERYQIRLLDKSYYSLPQTPSGLEAVERYEWDALEGCREWLEEEEIDVRFVTPPEVRFAGSPRNPFGTHSSYKFKGGQDGYKAAWRCHFSKVGNGGTSAKATGPIRGTVRRCEMIAAAMKPPCKLPGTDSIKARTGPKSPLDCDFPETASDYGLDRWKKPDSDEDREGTKLSCSDLKVIKTAALAEIKRRAQDREKEEKKRMEGGDDMSEDDVSVVDVAAIVREHGPDLLSLFGDEERTVEALVEIAVALQEKSDQLRIEAEKFRAALEKTCAQVGKLIPEAEAKRLQAEPEGLPVQVEGLIPRVERGDRYVQDLVEEAVKARTRAQRDDFDAEKYRERLLADPDVDYIKGDIESYEAQVGQKFEPGSPVRSKVGAKRQGAQPSTDHLYKT